MLIKNATIIDANKSIKADLLIKDSKIAKIAQSIKYRGDSIDAKGLSLLPGIIDINFNLQDPGNKSVESIDDAIKNAAIGGTTHIATMPYTNPVIDSDTTMEYLCGKVSGKKGAKLSIIASATIKGEGKKLSEQATLYKNGAVSCHINSNSDSNVLRRTFEYAWMENKTLFIRCSNEELEASGVMSDGEISSKLGLASIISLSQSCEIAKVCEMARYLDTKTLIQAISTIDGLEIIKTTKKKSEKIFTEVGINYLILNDELCDDFNTLAKIYPPLENEQTRKTLLSAIKNGDIDIISSHHTTQSMNSKDMPFNVASYGISNSKYLLPLIYTYLVKTENIDFKDISKLISLNPAKTIGAKNEGLIEEGFDANFVLFDTKATTLVPAGINSPYQKMELLGKVVSTWVDGKIV